MFTLIGILVLLTIYLIPKEKGIVLFFAILLTVNKGLEILYGLSIGNTYKIPIEYSTITYFLLPISIFTKNTVFKRVTNFMGLLTGIGYLSLFIVSGKTIYQVNGLYNTIQGLINHSIVLFLSLALLKEQPIKNETKIIWLATFLLVYYMIASFQITDYSKTNLFIREVLTGRMVLPYLDFFGDLSYVIYYGILIVMYHFAIKIYLIINRKISSKGVKLDEYTV